MLKASIAKPEAWVSWQIEIERRRCGTQLRRARQPVLNPNPSPSTRHPESRRRAPDREFLVNTAVDSFNVPKEKVEEFINVFLQTLKDAELLEDLGGEKIRVLDATSPSEIGSGVGEEQIKKLSKGVTVQATDTCFVMMPFADPLGGYYATVYQPAIEKAKLKAVRADAEIFGTGRS